MGSRRRRDRSKARRARMAKLRAPHGARYEGRGVNYLSSLADQIARAAARAPDRQTEAIDLAQAEVQRMLAEGRPLPEVYAVASRALALTLSGGLSPDRQRAWQMLVRTLREGSAEAGKIPPLERHPDWPAVI